MACEIGEMRIIVSEDYEEAFVNFYNKFMAENESWFDKDSDNKLTVGDLYTTLDIWHRFEDPFEPGLCRLCREFAIDNPDTYVYIDYNAGWDNSEETFNETILYRNGFLEDSKEYSGGSSCEKTTLYRLCDGQFVECSEDDEK